jgi:hypothetical protein
MQGDFWFRYFYFSHTANIRHYGGCSKIGIYLVKPLHRMCCVGRRKGINPLVGSKDSYFFDECVSVNCSKLEC